MATKVDCNECPDVEQVEVPTDLSNYCVKPNIADGTYGLITFTGGCITAASEAPLSEYTPTDCCTGGTTTGETQTITPSPDGCNMLQQIGSSWIVKPIIEDTDSIQVSGCGVINNPYRFEYIGNATDANTNIDAGNEGVSVSGTGSDTDPFLVSHNTTSNVANQTINGITFDEFGHVLEVNQGDDYDNLTGSQPITVTPTANGAEIGLQQTGAEGTYNLGGVTIIVGAGGVIQSITGNVGAGYNGSFQTGDGRTATIQSGIITGVA